MASLNKVQIIGNLGKDPEVRYTANNLAITNISVATSRRGKDANGEKTEETEWHRIVFFDKLAEIVGEYMKKGRPIYVEGRLRTRKWQDKEGKDQYTTEIVGESMQMLGDREGGGGQGGSGGTNQRQAAGDGGGNGYGQQTRGGHSNQRQATSNQRPAQHRTNTGFDEMDDDIPFITASMECDLAMPVDRRMRRYHYGR